MSSQEEGLVGKFVGGMIRRTVKSRLHTLWWSPPAQAMAGPLVFYANHHGWLDGYLMYHLVTRLGVRSLDWIEEFDAFPLFAKVGGMRFAKGDVSGRAATVKRTITLMKSEGRSLILFPEGVMHRPPEIWAFGRSLETVAKRVPGVQLIPTAIQYQLSMHERPEAWISCGAPHTFEGLDDAQSRLQNELCTLRNKVDHQFSFQVLAHGTLDVNERWDMRRFRQP